MQSQQRSQNQISDSRISKGQPGSGLNKMNAENSKNWRDDAKGKMIKTFLWARHTYKI